MCVCLSFAVLRLWLTAGSARLAPVMFLFERKGSIRISLDEADDLDARLERVVDVAFSAGAEDFESDEASEGAVEVEVYPMPVARFSFCNVLTALR